jgi:glycogen synthase
MNTQPARRVSVVINSDGRVKSLRNTIESLRYLDYSEFEVCTVYGPTPDGTKELIETYAADGIIKTTACPQRNLSQSRNLGIALSAGQIIAFIDDDAIPEPEWLSQLVARFDDEDVGGAGGFVFDHTGFSYQYRYSACDRLGNAITNLATPPNEYNLPFSDRFPYVQGTNSAFRREVLVSIGGFDEEYEFYLDETDLCCRLVDKGWRIDQIANAAVHHKFLPSHIRNRDRITTNKYPIIKNKIYFSFVNNHGHYSINQVIEDALRFVCAQRNDLEYHVRERGLNPNELETFEEDSSRAWEVGLSRGISRTRRNRPSTFFDIAQDFLPFRTKRSEGRRKTFVFFSQSYPPGLTGGNARHTHDIARAIGALGHTVHVFTQGRDFNRVDFEEGVWLHRLVPKDQVRRPLPTGEILPNRIWNYSATLLEELYRVAKFRRIDVVEGVSWDCECIATVLDGRFPSATNIVTALSHWLDTHVHYRDNPHWMAEFGDPMLKVESYLFTHSPGIVAASHAIAHSIEARYALKFSDSQIGYLPHGIVDTSGLPRRRPKDLREGSNSGERLAVLFVGRLELRKGIDVLLAAVPALLKVHPDAEVWIAGDDTIEIEPGLTAKQKFLVREQCINLYSRVHFLGRVDEEELRWLYANCAVFTAPSQFESFGLVIVEALMFGRPSVASRAGGMSEILEDGVSGVYVEPGSVNELCAALSQLLGDAETRDRMSKAARARFELQFDASVIAGKRIAFLSTLIRSELPWERVKEAGAAKVLEVGYGKQARSIPQNSAIQFLSAAPVVYVTFWKHAWSGFVEIWVDGHLTREIDLYSPIGFFQTETVLTGKERPSKVRVRRSGRKSEKAHNTEVLVCAIQEAVHCAKDQSMIVPPGQAKP